MKKILIILILSLFVGKVSANLDEKIEKFCNSHELSKEVYFKENMGKRCTLIWQAQIRFESKSCEKVIWNNCYWFRAWFVKEEWKKLWVTWINKWFLTFKDKTSSIIFYVDHFYKWQRYKTISQIVWWWKYCSPKTGWCGNIDWFTHTISHIPNYIAFVKKYFNTHK